MYQRFQNVRNEVIRCLEKSVYSSFPVIYKVGNVDICVQLLMGINWKWFQAESILMKIYIYHGALNEN